MDINKKNPFGFGVLTLFMLNAKLSPYYGTEYLYNSNELEYIEIPLQNRSKYLIICGTLGGNGITGYSPAMLTIETTYTDSQYRETKLFNGESLTVTVTDMKCKLSYPNSKYLWAFVKKLWH